MTRWMQSRPAHDPMCGRSVRPQTLPRPAHQTPWWSTGTGSGGLWCPVQMFERPAADRSTTCSPSPSPRRMTPGRWAHGDAGIGVGGGGDHVLIEHWNGHRWANVSPSFGGRARSYLLAVTSRSANDLWAMGDRRLQPRSVLMAHWEGSRWNTGPSLNGSLAAATTLRSGDIWAVGSTGSHREPSQCTAGLYQRTAAAALHSSG